MALSKAKFKNLASKLIKKTAGDIAGPATFSFRGSFDYATQSASETTELVDKVVVTNFGANEYNADELEQLKVEVGDVKMYVVKDDLTKDPRQSTGVSFDGVDYTIINVMLDGAEAAYTLQLRR